MVKKPSYYVLATTLLLTAIQAPAAAQERRSHLDVELRYWSPSLSGAVDVQEQGIGTRIDFESDLGIEDDEFFEGRLTWQITPRQKLRAAFVPIEYSGDGRIQRTITFGGQTFSIDERVVSDLELEYFRAGWSWQLIATRDGRFRAGPLVEVKAFRGEATLSAPDLLLPLTESREFEIAFGAVGAAVDVEVTDRLELFGEATVLVAADEGDLLDAEVGVRFFPTDRIAVLGGFRQLEIDAEEDDDLLDLDLDGIFFGVSLRL